MIISTQQAAKIINDSIKDEKAAIRAKRRQHIIKLLDYYTGDNTNQYIIDRFKTTAFQEVPPASLNITKRFIDRMSRIYTLGASRNINEQYDKLTILKDVKMKHFEKMSRLIGTVAIRSLIKYTDDNIPYFDYDPLYYFDAHFGDDPFMPIAIQYPLLQNTEDLSITETKLKHAYWDAHRFIIYDEEGNIEQEVIHNIGILPFTFLHREHQLLDFSVAGADDIINCNESINILLTEACLGMRFQMFGQNVITGLYQDEKVQRTGSDEIVILPEGSNFSNVAPGGNINEAISLIKTLLDICAQNNHLHVSFAESGSDRPTSGIALKIKDLERFEDYQDDLELYRLYEHKIYQVEKAVAKNAEITLPKEFNIDFNEPSYPQTAQDQIALEKWELENNITSTVDLLIKRNKELSKEEALEIINNNKEINGTEQEPQQAGSIFGQLRGAAQRPQ